jgi:hypothetical protein
MTDFGSNSGTGSAGYGARTRAYRLGHGLRSGLHPAPTGRRKAAEFVTAFQASVPIRRAVSKGPFRDSQNDE